MNIAYAGFDFFSACLVSLLESQLNVSQVYSIPCDNRYNFNNYIHDICRQYTLPISLKPIDHQAIKRLEATGCDVLITAAYPHKIPDLSATSIRGVNIHPSLLPIGRGRWPLPQTILKALPESGATLHKLSDKFDAGDILLQSAFPVQPQENLESLSCKVQIQAKQLVRTVFKDFDTHWRQAQPQSELGEYWSAPGDAERRIDWTLDVAQIDRIVRAFGKFESYALIEGHEWLVSDAQVWPERHKYPPGSVVHKTNTEVVVAASNGLVCLRYFYRHPQSNKT